MTITLPNPLDQEKYLEIPAEYKQALQDAYQRYQDELNGGNWENVSDKEGVKVFKKNNPEKPNDVPIVRGETIVENATPVQVMATIQVPGMRKKWDNRLDQGHSLERYSAQSFLFYTILKSVSFFVWARDIVGVQEIRISEDGNQIVILQTSASAEKYVSEDDSYQKSRTRATLEVGAWIITKQGSDTKLEYLVKVQLNGSLPTSIVSAVATDTPLCVGRVRDVFYSYGHNPYDKSIENGPRTSNTMLVHVEYEDGDGSEAQSGKKQWTGYYRGAGEETFTLQYDHTRTYPQGAKVTVGGSGASAVQTETEASGGLIKVHVGKEANGQLFSISVQPL